MAALVLVILTLAACGTAAIAFVTRAVVEVVKIRSASTQPPRKDGLLK